MADVAAGATFVEQWHAVPGLHLSGAGRIAIGDFDGDGLDDFVVAGRNYYGGANALFVVGSDADGARIKQSIILTEDPASAVVRLLSLWIGDVVHLYCITIDGTVRDFAGWPLAEQARYPSVTGPRAAVAGDVAGNGQTMLVVANAEGLATFDIATGFPSWTYPIANVNDLALAQLDGDAANEIVTSAGVVIDGATQATDWSYIDGFGGALATGHLLGDASTQFVGTYSNYFIAFRGAPWSPLWSAGSPTDYIGSIITVDLDGDGHDVIVTGTPQFGHIYGYDAVTREQRFAAPGYGWEVAALAAGKMFGESETDLAIAGTQSPSKATVRIMDMGSGAVPWSYTPWDGIFSPVAIADVDGDGRDEVVVAAFEPSGDNGTVAILDAVSGAVKWTAADPNGNGLNPFYISTAKILLVQHPQDDAMDIVLAGTSYYDGRILVFDGATHAVRLQIGSYASGPLGSREIVDAALVDYDGDGTLDYAVATQATSTATSGPKLLVFSGKDGHLLWESPALDSGFAKIRSVFVAGPPADPASKLVAAMPVYLQAFDRQTQELDWYVYAQSNGAQYLPDGIDGAEIMTFDAAGKVTFFDAADRSFLRDFTLETPLEAVLAPGGDSRKLVVSSNDSLVLIDGVTGATLGASSKLGAMLGARNQLAVRRRNDAVWDVASGTDLALFQHRLILVDPIFTAGFEPAP